MDIHTLIRSEKDSISIPELRKMLGIGKTESYWLIQNRGIKTFQLRGCMRVRNKDFWDWYDNQTKHRLLQGPPPGRALQETSYSVRELTQLLAVSRDTIYALMKKDVFDTFQADNHTRITKNSFERWYKQQVRFRTAADREKEADALKASYSMPEMAHLLGIQRDTVYRILAKKDSTFEMVVIAGQKRVTASSFEAWYQSQSHYQKVVAVQEPVPLEEEPAADEPTAGLSDAENETAAEHVQAKSVYRVCDLQRALGISRKAVYRKIQAREIKTMLVGKEYLISPAEFERITGGDKDGNHHSQEEKVLCGLQLP